MRRITLALVAVVLLVACAGETGSNEQLTAAHESALADTLLAEAERFGDALRELDTQILVDIFSDEPDFTYFDNGNPLDKEGVLGVATNFFSNVERLPGEWRPAEVVVLGPDAGLFWGLFRADENAVMKDGSPVWNTEDRPGSQLWSFMYRRADDGGWEIAHIHQTRLAPGRIDQYQ